MLQDYFAITNRTDLTKERARAILPILVRQALARQKITYADLGEELGIHHRPLRRPLGCIGDILLEMNRRGQEDIPQIQGLVVNQKTGLPGDNVHFLRHRHLAKQNIGYHQAIFLMFYFKT